MLKEDHCIIAAELRVLEPHLMPGIWLDEAFGSASSGMRRRSVKASSSGNISRHCLSTDSGCEREAAALLTARYSPPTTIHAITTYGARLNGNFGVG